MEKKIIGKENLADLFANNELEAATLLRDALIEVKKMTGNITDPDIKNYNNMSEDDAKFRFDISLTTIKNYAAKYGYGVFNVDGASCVVKQFEVDEYAKIRNELDKNKNQGNLDTKNNDNGLSEKEKMAVEIFRKSNEYREQSCINIRVANSVKERLEKIYDEYDAFTKQQIISYLLDVAITQLEDAENRNFAKLETIY